jgi:uncharacterized protein (TIGR02246 family)
MGCSHGKRSVLSARVREQMADNSLFVRSFPLGGVNGRNGQVWKTRMTFSARRHRARIVFDCRMTDDRAMLSFDDFCTPVSAQDHRLRPLEPRLNFAARPMEFTTRSIFPAIVFLLGSLSFSNVNQINAQTHEDEAAIRQAVAAMTMAFNARDDRVTASLTTTDADFVTVTGNWSKSSTDYIAARRVRFATALKNASIRVIDIKIRFLRPDIALAHVTHEIRGMSDDDGKELRVFVQQHGKWLMTAFHNTTLAMPAKSSSK